MKLLITACNFLNNVASPFFGPVSIKYICLGIERTNSGNAFFRLDPNTSKYNPLIRSNLSRQHSYHSEVSAVDWKSVMHGRSTVGVSSFQLEAHAFIQAQVW
jgi:hypothetical protein